MYVSTTEVSVPEAMTIAVTEDTLTAELSDGRTIAVPLAWHPRLVHATPEERSNWELIGGGQGIHWPDLDEDISVEGLLAGRKSGKATAPSSNGLRRSVRDAGLRCSSSLPTRRRKRDGLMAASKVQYP